jgi:hypothetical protein
MRKGTSRDLQRPVGQFVEWYLYNPDETNVDQVYDVGAPTGGRVWNAPVRLPVVNAYVFQSEMYQNDRGFYTVDTLRLFVNYDDVIRFIPTLDSDPDARIKDRVKFRSQTYVPNRVFPRGQIDMDYMMLMVDLTQVKDEEMVNDVFTPSEIIYPEDQL